MQLRFSILAFLFLPTPPLRAQTPPKQGVIIYDEALKLREQVAKENPLVAKMLPEEVHTKTKVFFNGENFAVNAQQEGVMDMTMSIGTSVAKSAGTAPKDSFAAGKEPKIDFDFPTERKLVNLKKGTLRTETSLAGRDYCTETTATKKKIAIRYHTGTKTIAGYKCSRAFVQIDSTIYMVWYTPQIPFAYNPMGLELATLKGAVLGYQTTFLTCTALSVNAGGASPANVSPNEKARKVTGEQMEDLKADYMETMTKKMGGQQFILGK